MNSDKIYCNIPVLPVKGITVFPYVILTIDALRDFSVKALEAAVADNGRVFVVSQKDISNENPDFSDVYEYGTLCSVKQILRLPHNSARVLIEGIKPARLLSIRSKRPFITGDIEMVDDESVKRVTKNTMALVKETTTLFEEYYSLSNHLMNDALIAVNSNFEDPEKFSYLISSNLNINVEKKQELLSLRNSLKRLKKIITILMSEIEILKIEEKIHSEVKAKMDKHQKEYYLREQLKAIHSELGDAEEISAEVDEFKEKLSRINFSDEIREKLEKEIKRLSMMPPSSHEATVISGYLQTVFDMPWQSRTSERINLTKSEKILEADHYGLKTVKERILEHIAVYSGSSHKKSTVICLVGPPGVGKTSIASSVARAVGRKFQRLSLGGVRDEADIRGHRKTYIGAMPGRIINAVKLSGVSNPLILLDEIDKMASDFRGDPASALLEVLDREQNHSFRDHYLEIPFDLSEVMFITTANTASTIPPALLDRMEVIELSSYTRLEKANIATKHLVPKQLSELGTDKKQIAISESAVYELIDYYTREAGVRNLEREIGSVIRKAICKMKKHGLKKIRINDTDIHEYLGARKYIDQSAQMIEEPGLATGLAYTTVGGTLIDIETNILDGSGKVELTGKLGDVMKESAMAAICYIRANSEKLGIDKEFYKTKDIHIHIPEGATPKDGPSAGITMATALISALTGRTVRKDIAMTGEVTIRGRVLAIGGLKEKSLAAHRNGIYNIIIPFENVKDIETLPEEVRDDFNFIPVKHMDEVVENAINKM